MAHDEDSANRVREVIGAEPDLTEKRMFGGLAFLLNGNMAVAVGSEGDIMVHVAPDTSDELTESGEADPVVMRGRPMRGWVQVGPERLHTRKQLARWVSLGLGYTRSLPPK
ncbi:RNA methyltransferase [Allosaccharopolyspora coralli]|uniref:RNA methyltransferase n=1 Tax=Allosaccharopolyspora coralli TaxID=2665642 RepID=A0A5Q3QB29_9PSEU|nr:TfoX/Sxy family protein [Allosaccharopolyspora coralli]QGK71593.1 RNA methyltransferase [Allosaccharopolyspora coralli]